MGFESINAFKALDNISKVKQREVFLPLTKMRALVTPLLTKDDLNLRTTIASPDLYDAELSFLLWSKTIFPDVSDKIEYIQFIENITSMDRSILIWGLFASTYGTLGTVDIKCPFCGFEFSDEIKAEQLLNEDSITPWDKDVPAKDYIFTVPVILDVDGVYKLEFETGFSTIKNHLEILKLIPIDKIRENYQKFGSIFNKPEELSSVTKKIKFYSTSEDPTPLEWTDARDIHSVICSKLTMDISDSILEKYNDHFNKYVPRFKKPFQCSNCLNNFNYVADPEVSLFRQFLNRR